MPTFTYRSYNEEGTRVCGSMKSVSDKAVLERLKDAGLNGCEVFTSKTRYVADAYKSVSPKELSIFCRQMSVMFYSQITLMEGVYLLAAQTDNKRLKTALEEIYEHMKKGYTLADSIGMYPHIFTAYLVNMISVGEASGTLDSVFARMSEYFNKTNKTRKKIRSAIMYPAVLAVLMLAIIILLVFRILPMFNGVLNSLGGEMPAVTGAIMSISKFISSYAWVIVGVIAVIIVAIYCYSRTPSGKIRLDKFILKIPVSKYLMTRIITSRFALSLAILLKSGVQLVNALADVKPLIGNKYLEKNYNDIVDKVKNGKPLSESLAELKIFPPLFLRLISIGEMTGHIDEMLEKAANVFDDEADEAAERLTVMIEPVLIIVLAVIVGVILMSVMLPMIDIMNAIS